MIKKTISLAILTPCLIPAALGIAISAPLLLVSSTVFPWILDD